MFTRVTLAALMLCVTPWVSASPDDSTTAVATLCSDQKAALPDLYYEAVLARIKPPDTKDLLLSIKLNGEEKIIIGTTGDAFLIWTDTPLIGQKSIHEFLQDLAGSCRLPYNPGDAAALIKVKWESKDLSASQFSRIHENFIRAASNYVTKAQDRFPSMMASKMITMFLDTPAFEIAYDNGHEHFEFLVWDTGAQSSDPMVKWSHDMLKLAEKTFDRPFGIKPTH